MKLLFTGASGFLGNNVRPILEKMYAVTTVGLASQDNYTVNIAKDIPKLYEHYDIVLHAAGKAHSIPRTESLFRCKSARNKKSLHRIRESWNAESFCFHFYCSSIWL